MLRFWFVFSATTFSSYNPDIAKKGASSRGVTPLRWRARGPNQGGCIHGQRKVAEGETVHTDDKTGRRYSYNSATGQSLWLPEDETTV